jgi:tRNA modification GTPase
MYADDTIAAVATPAGQGGVGIVRVSGPLCAQIAAAVFSGRRDSGDWMSHRLYYGQVVDRDGEAIDTGFAVLMRRPRSYTGEDVLELHCHGSPVALRRVLARVLSCGARSAEKGEFTKRAFLNGRLDLAQAEAVIEMVRARTDAGAALAIQQLSGRLSDHLAELRLQLIRVKALLEVQIDFSDEDFEVDSADLISVLDSSIISIKSLINTYRHGKLIRDGLRVVIVGKPNVGKSSLLNALLGEDRAIVTPLPGTTRDSIDETASFDGLPVVLSDTAGFRDEDQADTVERLGIRRTSAKMAEADLLLTVLDTSRPLDSGDTAVLAATRGVPQVIVLNKVDLEMKFSAEDARTIAGAHAADQSVVRISATHGIGLAELRHAVVTCANGGIDLPENGPVLTNLRHRDALTKASVSLQLARQSIADGQPPEIVAVDVQDAIDSIAAVTGAITDEEILDRVFSEFCIGK